MNTIKNRYDFVYIFDVQDGNPNGDPDAGNLPRTDTETGQGIVTDVCLKRKVRNYVQLAKEGEAGYDIFIREKAVLNNLYEEACNNPAVREANKKDNGESARQFMCKHYYDVRTFGAVIAPGKNAGQVRGPIQLTFSRSVDAIHVTEHTITRMAVTKQEKADAQGGANREMGNKATVPYGLYVCHGFVSAALARQTGFSADDLGLFWQALQNMFDNDRSAARGLMAPRALVVFRHDSELGNAPAHQLFDRVRVERTTEGAPRNFDDYRVSIDTADMPAGVTAQRLI